MGESFGAVLLRLKEETGLRADKEVAELLGMSDKAFHARKVRDAFPEAKLFELVQRRPQIDAAYVLTGMRLSSTERAKAGNAFRLVTDFPHASEDDREKAARGVSASTRQHIAMLRRRQPRYEHIESLLNRLEADEDVELVVAVIERFVKAPRG